MAHLSRRDLLRTAPAAAIPLLAGRGRGAEPPPPQPPIRPPEAGGFPGLTVRMHQPENLEFPFSALDSFHTPTERFFVRSHFAVPTLDAKTWRLKVEGAVEEPLELDLAAIRKMPAVQKHITLECAGNGRVFITPPARGLQWGFGAVSTASWTGVLLSAILEKAKVKRSAVEVVLVGADKGAITADPATPGPIHFARSLPLEKATKPEVVLAYQMNDEDLPPAHGYPLRAVVGGWYGMASVKWLNRIIVTEKPFNGYWQTFDYSYYVRGTDGEPEVVPVTAIQPKALIARPTLNEVVPAGKPCRLFGAAWAGEHPVAKVEVSTDGGKQWTAARLEKPHAPFAWSFWEYTWNVPASTRGPVKLLARATDAKGTTQPDKRDPDRRSYMINHLVPVEVVVR